MIETLPLDAFCRALLDENPKTSARELAAAWLEVHGEDIPRARFKRIRDAWNADRKAGGQARAPDPDEPSGDPPTLQELHARLAEAAQAGDARACVSFATVIRTLAGLGGVGPEASAEDWARLTRPEAECLTSLTAKLYGQPLDETCLRWVGIVAAVPPLPDEVHTAHMPLPDDPGSGKV